MIEAAAAARRGLGVSLGAPLDLLGSLPLVVLGVSCVAACLYPTTPFHAAPFFPSACPLQASSGVRPGRDALKMSKPEMLDFGEDTVAPDVSHRTIAKAIKKKARKTGKGGKKEPSGVQKYTRGEKNSTKGIKSFALRKKLKHSEALAKKSAETSARSEILLPSDAGYVEAEGMEQTWRFTQESLREHVDVRSAKKMFDLTLDQFGPYVMDYTRNGAHMLLAGRKGHVAGMEWKGFKLGHELHLRETIRDIRFLHDETMYAVAQKKYVYIYDNTGTELHCLRNRVDVNCLEFLPYHFLLVAAGKSGYLQYTDTSTGANVAEHKTRLGEVKAMKQNPRNAIIHLGHNNGTVTLWSPNVTTPHVKMLCHSAPVTALDVEIGGNYMTTAGLDGQVKVWDIRTYKEVHAYFTVRPATTISTSDMVTAAHTQLFSLIDDVASIETKPCSLLPVHHFRACWRWATVRTWLFGRTRCASSRALPICGKNLTAKR